MLSISKINYLLTMITTLLLGIGGQNFLAAQRPTDYIDAAINFSKQKKYSPTLRTLNEGIKQYPKNPDLYFARGNFYFKEKMYKKALTNLLLSQKYGYVNQAELALILTKIYDQQNNRTSLDKMCSVLSTYFSENQQIIADILWYYLKIFQIDKGIALGEIAIQKWPDSASLHALLASLYLQYYNYEKVYFLYKKALALSLSEKQYGSASQILYNHARTEKQFYHFEQAENLLQMSLNIDNNPASYRFLAELFLNMLSYNQAKNMIQISEKFEILKIKDSKGLPTPLANFQLVELYLTFYKLDEAQKILENFDRYTNYSWMYQFKISQNRYFAWLYQLKRELYKKKVLVHKRSPHVYFKIFYPLLRLKVMFLHFYYDKLFRSWTLKDVHLMFYHGLNLSAYQHAIQITKPYLHIYKNFLEKASLHETAFTEKAKPSYMALQSLADKNSQLRDKALQTLDPIYEAYQKQNLLESWIQIEKKYLSQNLLILKLYKLNPTATRVYGLPIRISMKKNSDHRIKSLRKILGMNLRYVQNSPYLLDLKVQQNILSITVKEDEILIHSFTIPLSNNTSRKEILVSAKQILNHLYNPGNQ